MGRKTETTQHITVTGDGNNISSVNESPTTVTINGQTHEVGPGASIVVDGNTVSR